MVDMTLRIRRTLASAMAMSFFACNVFATTTWIGYFGGTAPTSGTVSIAAGDEVVITDAEMETSRGCTVNIAAGATLGSNHNGRKNDVDLVAGRGFWPGLCSDFKHNSRFASFTLVSKGSYQNELDIPYPFALVAPGNDGSPKISIIPAWWFMYDMFAITRNKNKFIKRDKRVKKVQVIETDPLAPDTMQ